MNIISTGLSPELFLHVFVLKHTRYYVNNDPVESSATLIYHKLSGLANFISVSLEFRKDMNLFDMSSPLLSDLSVLTDRLDSF